jgi:mono/diheme cytochrome c family protein
MYLPWNASRARLREAANAQKNRKEIVEALSHGKVTRRELIKWGLFTSAGLLVPKSGLSPFAKSAYADSSIPTGLPPSPLFGVKPFTQPMLRFDVLPRKPVSWLDPAPTEQANTTMQLLDPALVASYPTTGNPAVDYYGPIEGRPPGALWAHQRWDHFFPSVAIEVTQEGAKDNTSYNPGVVDNLNNGFNRGSTIPLKFHPGLPTQDPLSVWTFNGTIPPKLAMIRYYEPVLFRHHNKLPYDITKNRGFGRHTITTHKHNAHHGAENDGFTGAYFYPGQFYDYHWPICHAGYDTINVDATDSRCGGPDDNGGINKCPGDWRETMSTHWFHDHMFSFEVERRKYRFRILNGAVSRFFKVAIADASGKAVPIIQIANDGNLLPQPVVLTALDEQGIAERYDIVVDFSRYKVGDKLWMTNLCEHQSGTGPSQDLSLSDALAGKDIFFYSISIDPAHDTPAVLKEYAEKFHVGPGWLFLTGKQADIKLISKKLGLSSATDALNRDGHQPSLMIGKEATGQWMRQSAEDNPRFLAAVISNFVGKRMQARSYAEARALPALDEGHHIFEMQCAACHTIGKGDGVGPDLLGVTRIRDRAWLARFIAAPDRMLAEKDAIAAALLAKYKNVVMPNLRLGRDEVEAVVAYLESETAARHASAAMRSVTTSATDSVSAHEHQHHHHASGATE